MTTTTVTVTEQTEDVALSTTATTVALAADSRTITGRVLPFDEPGGTSIGELIFPPGSISIPADLSRVKLLAGHSPNGVPVGVATNWQAKADGLYMTFQLGSHAAADEAIALATEHVVDSFSVEATGIVKTGRTVNRSLLKAVALVPFPAFATARVAEVSAEDHTPTVTPEPESRPEGRQSDSVTPDPEDVPATPAIPTDSDTPTDTDTDAEDDDTDGDNPEKETDPVTTTIVPKSLAQSAPTEAHASMNDVLDFIAVARNGDPTEAHAALVDITRSAMTNAVAPAWLGELWGGVTYERTIIPLLANKPLLGMKAQGYRWTTKPGVEKYAGDKAEIPSKPAAISPVEVLAQRWAGGNDLDRAFWDFNETEILRAYWAAMAESYAMETDNDAAAFLNTNATEIATPAPDFIRGVARAGLAVYNSTKSAATFALVNPADVESVLDFAELDAPKYMNLVPVANPENWTLTDQVTAGTAVVGTKSAVDFWELAGSPLRVEAEHLANGGRDAALFGYTAINLAKAGGVQKITVGTAPAGS